LISKRRGRSSNRRKPEAVRTKALSIIRDHYWDFGPTLAAEKLGEVPQIALGRETLLADFSSSAGSFYAIPANYLLAEAVQRPAATVYAAFAGIGTAGTAVVRMVFFGESTDIGRICSSRSSSSGSSA
jgi:hypothetical protein